MKHIKLSFFISIPLALFLSHGYAATTIIYSSDNQEQTISSGSRSFDDGYGYRNNSYYVERRVNPQYTTEDSYEYYSPNSRVIIRNNIRPVYEEHYYYIDPRYPERRHYIRPRYPQPPLPPPRQFPDRPKNGSINPVPQPPQNTIQAPRIN